MKNFEFQQLCPDLQWLIMKSMDDKELVNLCRSSKAMERFCNTRDWFWHQRLESRFDFKSNDKTIQAILKNRGSWFRVYFTLLLLRNLKSKLTCLSCYTLLEIYNSRHFSLNDEKFSELPPEIGQLTNLRGLYLRYANVMHIPAEIGYLVNLQYLDLSFTPLGEVPPEIGKLTDLRLINLEGTNANQIPTEILQLKNLLILRTPKI